MTPPLSPTDLPKPDALIASDPLESPITPPKARRGPFAFLRPSHSHTAASATILLTLSALLSRVIGLVRDQYIAYKFGAGHNTDAYNVAFFLPEWINYLLVGGAASITFVTILDRYRADDNEAEGERALSIILNTMVIVLGAAILLAEIFAPLFTRIYFDPASPEGLLCTRITRILLPAQLFFFSGGVLASVLLVRKQFSFQAVSPLIYNLGIIFGGVLLASRMGVSSLGVGALIGAILGPFLLNAYGAYRAGLRYHPIINLKHPGLREWVRLSLPLMLGVTIITLDSQILGFFAKHGSGDISRLNYAKRLFTAPMAIIGQAAGAASMPFFASLFGRKQLQGFAAAVNRSVSRLVAFSLVGSAGMIALAEPAVSLLFRRGSFHASDAAATAAYFAIFAPSLALWTAQAIYARAFYAAGETFTPMLAGTIVTVVTIPIYWQLHLHFGVIGLAWASNIAIFIQTATLALLAHRRALVPLTGLDLKEIARSLLAAAVSFCGIELLLYLVPHSHTQLANLTILTAGAIAWGILCAVTLHLAGSKLLTQLRRS